MANWNTPALTDTYANFLAYLKDRDLDLAKGLDPAKVTVTNPPTDSIRWNSANSKWEKFNGTSWADLSTTYAISITGNAATATKLSTARTLSVTIVTTDPSNPTFDGAADKTLQAKLTSSLVTTALGFVPVQPDGTGATGSAWAIGITGTSGNTSSISSATGSSYTFSANNYLRFGANTTSGGTLQIGGNGVEQITRTDSIASVVTTNGNLHLDAGAAKTLYLNYYSGTGGLNFGNGSSASIGTLTAAGELTVSSWIVAGGDVTAFSDERWKKNWRDLPASFVADLAGLKMGIYDRIDTLVTQVGVSAQALRKIMPNAVLESGTGNLSVAYGNAALASCVALAREFVAMQDEIAVMKQELASLKG